MPQRGSPSRPLKLGAQRERDYGTHVSRYLVTGSTGFLGRHLVATLRAHGHHVVALVRGTAASDETRDGVEEVRGDILDRASVERAADGCDGVFHCAGKVSRRAFDAEELQRVHVEGTKIVLDACLGRNVSRAVVASTSGTVALSDDPRHIANEDDATPLGIISRWPYYRSKLFAEKAALERNGASLPNGGTFDVVSVNPALLLGPGDVNGSSTDDVRLFLERKIHAIPPGGIAYVDARDAAEGMRLAMEKGEGGRRYLLGASNVTLREFFARLERISGVRGPLLPMPRARGASDVVRTAAQMLERLTLRLGVPMPVDPVSLDMAYFYWYVDATRAESELGWSPRDPMETLADTVRCLEQRGVVWPDASMTSVASSVIDPLLGRVRSTSSSRSPDGETRS